jgi:hypothetical protein
MGQSSNNDPKPLPLNKFGQWQDYPQTQSNKMGNPTKYLWVWDKDGIELDYKNTSIKLEYSHLQGGLESMLMSYEKALSQSDYSNVITNDRLNDSSVLLIVENIRMENYQVVRLIPLEKKDELIILTGETNEKENLDKLKDLVENYKADLKQ